MLSPEPDGVNPSSISPPTDATGITRDAPYYITSKVHSYLLTPVCSSYNMEQYTAGVTDIDNLDS